MIKRESYMRRIRPFINGELVKVMTGIRRSGKSVMLELVKQELLEMGVRAEQFISINFEDMRYLHLCTAQVLHQEILTRAEGVEGKVYLFFDEKSASTPCGWPWTVTSTSPAPTPSCSPGSWPPIWAGGMWSL